MEASAAFGAEEASWALHERMRFDGTIEAPLTEEDVQAAIEVFERENVDCIAVVFLHSYVNPLHELAAEELIVESGFAGPVSSSRVSGEFREYERTSTTVIDAYIRPAVVGYLRHLKTMRCSAKDSREVSSLLDPGAAHYCLRKLRRAPLKRSTLARRRARRARPRLSQELKLSQAITADVGGTSFDTCLLVEGRPETKYVGSVDDMPLQAPWVDVRSIGAGGGSIAYVDAGGLLRVGPQSSGGPGTCVL